MLKDRYVLDKNGKRRKIVDAETMITFNVDNSTVKKSIICDKNNCVAANGLKDSYNGLEYVEIGASVCYIDWVGENIRWRYITSSRIRQGLTFYDKTKHWHLANGEYYLLAPSKGQSRLGTYLRNTTSNKDRKSGYAKTGRNSLLVERSPRPRTFLFNQRKKTIKPIASAKEAA